MVAVDNSFKAKNDGGSPSSIVRQMIVMFRLSEKKFLVVAWHCKQRVDHSKVAAINKQPPLFSQCSWPTDSYSAETIGLEWFHVPQTANIRA
jgi:hypothetical protein